jgi:hypothetical protein
MAVELAKVSLWLEALDPGKPLSFLDAHIKCGNALIGATPALIEKGIPDKAFKAIEGDDEKWAAFLLKTNEKERTGQDTLFDIGDMATHANTELAAQLTRITAAPSGSLRDVHRQAADYHTWAESTARQRELDIANAWCAAFMWRKNKDAPPAITYNVFNDLKQDDGTLLTAAVAAEVDRLAAEYSFFHWHLEFPDIFRVPDSGGVAVDPNTGWAGGFTVLLGNPPWDRLEFEDKKYFASVEPTIAKLSGRRLHARIAAWLAGDHDGAQHYRTKRRELKGMSMFASSSGVFPLCAKGLTAGGVTKLQVDQLFAELFATIIAASGRAGCIIPTAIATGAGGQFLYGGLTKRGAIASLYDFENRGRRFFPGVHASYTFCLLALTGKAWPEPLARYAFSLVDPADLDNVNRVFTLSPDELALISPNTGTPPVFRSRRDADLTTAIYGQMPVLSDDALRGGGLWNVDFKYVFRSANDADILRTREELERDRWRLDGNVFNRDGKRMLPLYEAKMVVFFNHRAADVVKSDTALSRQNQPSYLTVIELQDPSRFVTPWHWVAEEGPILVQRDDTEDSYSGITERLSEASWDRGWLCGWCDVTASTNERTAIPVLIPRVATLNTLPLMFPQVPSEYVVALVAAQSSLVFDFVSRQRIGGTHMTQFIWKQLPVPTPAMIEPHLPFITPRVLELVYTAYDMTPFARDLGDEGEPFCWDEDRRAQLCAELDAFFFRLYGIDDRDDVDYICETFQTETGGLKHNDISKYGTYRTKDLVLAAYDAIAAADAAGTPYKSPLTPPPGQGPRHPARKPGRRG